MRTLAARGVKPEDIYTAPSVFTEVQAKSFVVTYREIVNSEYNTVHCRGAEKLAYDTADEFVMQVEKAVKSSAQKKFIYAYWPHYDQCSHRFGSESPQAAAELARIDDAFAQIMKKLAGTDTLVLATSDHGFVDAPAEDCLELPGALASQLRFPLCGERRVAYCHVHAADEFIRRAKDWLGDKADVMKSQTLVDDGWFGPGRAHERFRERIGDVTIVMRGKYTVKDWTVGEPRWLHLGNHGGTHEDEMTIPLIMEEA